MPSWPPCRRRGPCSSRWTSPPLPAIGSTDAAERALAAEAWRRLAAAATEVHLTLAVMHGAAEGAGASLLFDAPFRSYFFDLCAGPDNWRLISRAPQDRGIIAGVADARVARLDSKEILVWGARYAAALGDRGLERVGIAPSAGTGDPEPRAGARQDPLARRGRRGGRADRRRGAPPIGRPARRRLAQRGARPLRTGPGFGRRGARHAAAAPGAGALRTIRQPAWPVPTSWP